MSLRPDNPDLQSAAVFLDVDGTLLEICDNPGDVTADVELLQLLQACHAAVAGALALVSGRTVAELDRIFEPAVLPAAGAHGAEIRTRADGCVHNTVEAVPAAAIEPLREFVAAHEGLLLEKKHGGVSLHYRRAPQLEEACRRQAQDVLSVLGDGYRLIAGKMVFEITPAGCHKGTAIEAMLGEDPFSGRKPIFIGDDVTDEDGFRVVNELGGTSVLVGAPGKSCAQTSLPDVAAVRRWLSDTLAGTTTNSSEEAVF